MQVGRTAGDTAQGGRVEPAKQSTEAATRGWFDRADVVESARGAVGEGVAAMAGRATRAGEQFFSCGGFARQISFDGAERAGRKCL